ncbi:MAG: hypothetical protein WD646_05930 [Actinomycetota bacterium]
MAIDEHSRHELYLKLEQVLGSQEAATLMEHLPPVGWADVATKRDLDHVLSELDHVRTEILATIRAEVAGGLAAQQRQFVSLIIGLNLTLSGLVFAAAKLI